MTIEDFISKHILHHISEETGYLAQHDIFQQIHELQEDIDIPDYCLVLPSAEEDDEQDSEVLTQLWFGPIGTHSPLHHDPFHNLLVQVVGRYLNDNFNAARIKSTFCIGYKYVRLYSEKETPRLYTMEGNMSNNRCAIPP